MQIMFSTTQHMQKKLNGETDHATDIIDDTNDEGSHWYRARSEAKSLQAAVEEATPMKKKSRKEMTTLALIVKDNKGDEGAMAWLKTHKNELEAASASLSLVLGEIVAMHEAKLKHKSGPPEKKARTAKPRKSKGKAEA